MKRENGILYEEIAAEILSLLPQKSLCRFKCISKQWCNLISKIHRRVPVFLWQSITSNCPAQSQHDCSLKVNFHFVESDGSIAPYPPLDFTFQESSILNNVNFRRGFGPYVADSCNGLLLIMTLSRYLGPPDELSCLCHIYNPSTKNLLMLPPIFLRLRSQFGMVFDGCSSYKVICFFGKDSLRHEGQPSVYRSYDFMIFSSETGEWKGEKVPVSPPHLVWSHPDDWMISKTPCLVGRAMHWVFYKRLLLYHLEGNYCKHIEMPERQERPRGIGAVRNECLFESGENLHYCLTEYCGIRIWELHHCHQGNFEWQMKHTATWGTIESENIIPQGIELAGKYSMHRWWRGDLSISPFVVNDEFVISYLCDGKTVFSYHIASGKLKAWVSPIERSGSWRRKCVIFPFSCTKVGPIEDPKSYEQEDDSFGQLEVP